MTVATTCTTIGIGMLGSTPLRLLGCGLLLLLVMLVHQLRSARLADCHHLGDTLHLAGDQVRRLEPRC
jgi:hypothetical protein